MKNRFEVICHVSEVEHDGDYVLLPWTVDGEVVVTRIDGRLIAFDNRCPHRGARIFTELRGNRPPVCGYHGRRARVIDMNEFPLVEIAGWVAVSRGIEHIDEIGFGDDWVDALEAIGGSGSTAAVYHSTIASVYDCDWTVAVENALDSEHISAVHRDTLATLRLRSAMLDRYGAGSSFEHFKAENSRTLDRLSDLFEYPTEVDYFHLHLFPYTALSSTRGTTYSLQHYFPRADGKTNFISRLYSSATVSKYGDMFVNEVAKFNAKVFSEDAAICALVAPFHDGKLQANEKRIAHFRDAIKAST